MQIKGSEGVEERLMRCDRLAPNGTVAGSATIHPSRHYPQGSCVDVSSVHRELPLPGRSDLETVSVLHQWIARIKSLSFPEIFSSG
uniref:Uncharacterized protein n=1 Tax=Setaria digitata TaxID=48799 RepID=A0A915Q6L7_9BILA